VGHIFKDCRLNRKARDGEKEKVNPQKISHSQGSPPVAKEAIKLTQVDAEKAPSKEPRKKRGKGPFGPPSPPFTRARAVAEATFSTGMLDLSSSSAYSTSSSFCITSNNV